MQFGKRTGKRQADAGAFFLAIAFQSVEGFEDVFPSFFGYQGAVVGEPDGQFPGRVRITGRGWVAVCRRLPRRVQADDDFFLSVFYGVAKQIAKILFQRLLIGHCVDIVT